MYNISHCKVYKKGICEFAWLLLFVHILQCLQYRREDESRRRRFRHREAGGWNVNDGISTTDGDTTSHNDSIEAATEEDGYGALCSQARSEEIYHDLCSLNLPSSLPTSQVGYCVVLFMLITFYYHFIIS